MLKAKVKKESNYKQLKSLLHSNDWPVAVCPAMLCNEEDESDKIERAKSILDFMITKPMEGLKFLDFGCGHGHVASIAAGFADVSVGYDIDQQWEENNDFLTTDFSVVKERGLYDIILLYDVLDHAENPIDVLRQVKDLLNQGGLVYIRNHPWCSRHGSHLYRTLNKAYVHLVFTPEELKEMGYLVDNVQRVIHPISTYNTWLKKVGFELKNQEIVRSFVEPFFRDNSIIKSRIKHHWCKSSYEAARHWPRFQMEQAFLDQVVVSNN